MPYLQQMRHEVQWFLGGKLQWSIIKMLVMCVKCNNVLSLQQHQYLSWIIKKKINIYPSVSSGIGGGTKTEKKMKVIIAFTTSCLVNIQSFCLYNKLQTDSDWLGSHNIIIEKTDLINSIVGINQ